MKNYVLFDEINDLFPHLDSQEPTLSSMITEARKAMDNDDFVLSKSLLHAALTFDKNNAFVIQRLDNIDDFPGSGEGEAMY
jgi:hypothetical protein